MSKQIKQAILGRVEELCALLASRNESETTANGKATGSRQDKTSASSADNRCDSQVTRFFKKGYGRNRQKLLGKRSDYESTKKK